MNWIDNNLDLHGRAMVVRTARAEVIAGNIANADTPRYKAKDVDFAAALEAAGSSGGLRTTHSRHIGGVDRASGAVYEREDPRVGPDGNTVHMEVEKADYAENAVKFQASAQFFDGSLRGLRKALTGE